MAAEPGARVRALEADPVLGAPLRNYVSDRLRLLVAGGLVVLGVGLFLNFTIGTIQEGWGPLLTVLLTAAVVLGTGWAVLHWWNREIILYQRGFSVQEGARVVPVLYSEVAQVRLRAERVSYLGVVRHDRYCCTLTTIYDEQIVVDWQYRHATDCGTRLNALVDAALRPQLEARWAAGGCVPFGDSLALSAEGVVCEGQTLPWSNYRGYRVAGGRLVILDAADTAWASPPLGSLFNLTLLLAVLKEQRPSSIAP